MTQTELGTIDPNETSGTELAALLTAFGIAHKSGNRGPTRPTYAVMGTLWVQTVSSSNHTLNYFTGTVDIPLIMINPVTATAIVPLATLAGTAAALSGGVGGDAALSTRLISTSMSLTGGGSLEANRTLALVGDVTTPGLNKVYGTDAVGARGWRDIPVTPKPVRKQIVYTSPGTHTFVCPAVQSVWVTCIAAGYDGGFVYGFEGGLPVVGGTSYTVVVGHYSSYPTANSSFNGNIAYNSISGSTGVLLLSGHNAVPYYPMIRNHLAGLASPPGMFGDPGYHGYVRVEWIE
jgi:hypothetical protein